MPGSAVKLTTFEYNCLEYLMLNRGKILSKQQIIDELHDSESEFESNVLEVLIYSLRKKIGNGSTKNSAIKTKRGYGYYIE